MTTATALPTRGAQPDDRGGAGRASRAANAVVVTPSQIETERRWSVIVVVERSPSATIALTLLSCSTCRPSDRVRKVSARLGITSSRSPLRGCERPSVVVIALLVPLACEASPEGRAC